MAKVKARRRTQPPLRKARRRSPASLVPGTSEQDQDLSDAETAANTADQKMQEAEAAQYEVSLYAEQAERVASDAVMAAVQALDAANWVLQDAQRMVDLAAARLETAQAMVEADSEVREDVWPGGDDEPLSYASRAVEISTRQANRAMLAVSPRRRR